MCAPRHTGEFVQIFFNIVQNKVTADGKGNGYSFSEFLAQEIRPCVVMFVSFQIKLIFDIFLLIRHPAPVQGLADSLCLVPPDGSTRFIAAPCFNSNSCSGSRFLYRESQFLPPVFDRLSQFRGPLDRFWTHFMLTSHLFDLSLYYHFVISYGRCQYFLQ